MLAENPLPDGLLGPVASCIIADQFVRLKRGDRFWYETADPMLSFRPGICYKIQLNGMIKYSWYFKEQLATLRDVTLARILCDNSDALDLIQDRALEAISEKNPRKHCSGYQIARLDLTRWWVSNSFMKAFIL